MKARSHLIFAAALATTLLLAGCKKPAEPTPTPAPQSSTQTTESDSGTTTTFASPATPPESPPPAEQQ